MDIKIVPHPPYDPDLAPCDFWLFPKLMEKLRRYRYETIEEMKEVVTKVINTLTQEDIHGAFQKLLERYNKCIAAGGDYFEGDVGFMCVLSIKVPILKKSGNVFNDPHISSLSASSSQANSTKSLHSLSSSSSSSSSSSLSLSLAVSLSRYHHLSLTSIIPGRFFRLYPVSTQS